MESSAAVTAADWIKGIAFSVLASVIGGASKLAIRKSWLMVEGLPSPGGAGAGDSDDNLHNGGQTPPAPSDAAAPGAAGQIRIPGSPLGIELQERQASASSSAARRSSSASSASGGGGAAAVLCTIPSSIPSTATSFLDEGTPQTDPTQAKRICRRSHFLRLCGMVGMTILNPLCCVLAMNYASPSILAPFSGLTLVWIVLFSESLIGERPTLVQVMAAALIIFGETIVAIFGDHTNDTGKSVEDVRDSYKESSFLVYFVAMVVWLGLLGYLMTRSRSKTMRRFAWGVSGGSVTGLQNFLKDSLTVRSTILLYTIEMRHVCARRYP